MVTNHETWITDINNYKHGNSTPEWHKLYDAKNEYNLRDLSPSSWYNLVYRMDTDNELFQKFYR